MVGVVLEIYNFNEKNSKTVPPDQNGIDFPDVNYDFSQSRTDVMHYNIGLHFTSKWSRFIAHQ